MAVSSKWWIVPVSFICGIVGGVLGNWMTANGRDSATFETVRVTKNLFVAPNANADKGCRISADGAVITTGGLVANQVRGNVVVGHTLLASTNATQQSLENQEIAAEITANADRGGEIILRNRDAVLCPAKGPATKGYATVVGFDKANQMPAIFTEEIAQGPQGRAFFVCAKPKPAARAEPETATQTNQAAPQPTLTR